MERSPNNAYFEQSLLNQLNKMSEDDIVQRISDCQMVIDRIETDPVWHILLKDANEWVGKLDASWQEIEDDKQRNYARVLKFAYMHIKNLPDKYRLDLENSKRMLAMKENTSTVIPKDYDLETKVE